MRSTGTAYPRVRRRGGRLPPQRRRPRQPRRPRRRPRRRRSAFSTSRRPRPWSGRASRSPAGRSIPRGSVVSPYTSMACRMRRPSASRGRTSRQAKPGFPDSARAGFAFEGDFAHLSPQRHELTVVATNRAGVSTVLARRSLLPPAAMQLVERLARRKSGTRRQAVQLPDDDFGRVNGRRRRDRHRLCAVPVAHAARGHGGAACCTCATPAAPPTTGCSIRIST